MALNKAQSLITDRDTIIRFEIELITEHMIAQSAAKNVKRVNADPKHSDHIGFQRHSTRPKGHRP
jgi:hypothetical protein